eukprot:753625-Hanusia_phi.AAC.2
MQRGNRGGRGGWRGTRGGAAGGGSTGGATATGVVAGLGTTTGLTTATAAAAASVGAGGAVAAVAGGTRIVQQTVGRQEIGSGVTTSNLVNNMQSNLHVPVQTFSRGGDVRITTATTSNVPVSGLQNNSMGVHTNASGFGMKNLSQVANNSHGYQMASASHRPAGMRYVNRKSLGGETQQQNATTLEQQMMERASSANFAGDGLGRPGGRVRRQAQRTMADFFVSEQLRNDLATRSAQTALMLGPNDPRSVFTPHVVRGIGPNNLSEEYHTLFPLDGNVEEPEISVALGCTSRVYKAVRSLDAGSVFWLVDESNRLRARQNNGTYFCTATCALRKLDGNWQDMIHPSLVRLRNIFITNEWDHQNNALTRGKAIRCLDASKVLSPSSSSSQIDLWRRFWSLHNIESISTAAEYLMSEDLRNFGTLLLQTLCRSPEACLAHNLSTSVDFISAHYPADLKDFIVYLITQPAGQVPASIFSACARISGRLLEQVDFTYQHIDTCYNELTKEIQNGRLFRLLVKLNMIIERPQPGTPAAASWSETGDRYLLKLFMDYVFHQRDDSGNPVVDWGAVVQRLNKLDVGVSEKILLMSPDENTILVVSYADLKGGTRNAYAFPAVEYGANNSINMGMASGIDPQWSPPMHGR